MGRPPCNGAPPFRFNPAEIMEMEEILQAHKTVLPERQVLVSLAEKFSKSEERSGKIEVQMRQVWNWFQNRRYAIRAKAAKGQGKLNVTQVVQENSATVKSVPQAMQPHAASSVKARSLPQAPQLPTVHSASVRTLPQAPQNPPGFPVQSAGRVADNPLEYEAKSARDGAWYDISTFLSHRYLETGDLEVLVRLVGFGAEEDEWVNVLKYVRQRSLPCESSECVAVLPADLILCFQEGKDQALYFDAHVLDSQRRRHDVRGCRCRFLVRYDHDQSEEIVPLRKICRRPETDYRLQQLHALNASISANQNKDTANNTVSTLRVYPPAEVLPKQEKPNPAVPPEAPQKRPRLDSVLQPEESESRFKVEPVVMTDIPQPLVELQKVEPVVPVSSAQGSGECQNAVRVAPTGLDEAPVELQLVQPVMPDRSSEVSADSLKVETNVVVSFPEPSEEHNKDEPVPSGEVPETAGSTIPTQAESPVEPAELHEVQLDVPVSTNVVENKAEEPVSPVSTNDPNVVEAIESKIEELVVPVSTNDPNVVKETKTEEPVVSVSSNDPYVVQETKTEEPVAPTLYSNSNVVQEPLTPVSTNDCNMVQEIKAEEPVAPITGNDPNVVQEAMEAQTAENMAHVYVAQDDKTEEPVLTTNGPSSDQG